MAVTLSFTIAESMRREVTITHLYTAQTGKDDKVHNSNCW